jgi:hypothetical protein
VVGILGFNYQATSRCEGFIHRVSHAPASLRLSAEPVGEMHFKSQRSDALAFGNQVLCCEELIHE